MTTFRPTVYDFKPYFEFLGPHSPVLAIKDEDDAKDVKFKYDITKREWDAIWKGGAKHVSKERLKSFDQYFDVPGIAFYLKYPPNLNTSNRSLKEAAEMGNLTAVKWIHDIQNITPEKWCGDHYPMSNAARHGHLHVIKWFYDKYPYITKYNLIIYNAAEFNHLKTVKWLYSVGARIDHDKYYITSKPARYGHLETIQWLHSKGAKLESHAITLAAMNGHLETVQWIHSQGIDIPKHAIQYASEYGHIKTVIWLYNKGFSIKGNYNYCIRSAAKLGKFDMVKWLYEHGANIHDTRVLSNAAKFGYINIVKWLHSMGVNIRADNNIAIRSAIMNGRLDTVKWLESKGANPYDKYTKTLDGINENLQTPLADVFYPKLKDVVEYLKPTKHD